MGTVVYRQLDEIETVSIALRRLGVNVHPKLIHLWSESIRQDRRGKLN
jgi:hypothetical protein